MTRINNHGNKVFPSRSSGGSGSRQITRIRLKELLNLPHSSLKIGPLTGKKWYRLLEKHFNYVYANSFEVRKYFPGLSALLAVKPPSSDAGVDERMKASLGLQFHGGFMQVAAGKVTGDKEQTKISAIIFCALLNLSYNIRERQAQQRPFDDLIQTANSELDLLSEKLPVGFEVVK